MSILLLNKRQLTVDDIKTFSDEFIGETDMCLNDRNQEDLNDGDFIIGIIEYNNKLYNLIHGFPGNNPRGLIYDNNYNIIAELEHSLDEDNDFIKWYNSLDEKEIMGETLCLDNEEKLLF
jgi:hypothetical protein